MMDECCGFSFDLIETPQMHWLPACPVKGARSWQTSALSCLYSDLARLSEEPEATVIRVGKLEAFSARLLTLSAPELVSAIDNLSENDWDLWRLINARKEKPVSIEFPSTGNVSISMPLLPTHIAERQYRRIQFRVVAPTRDKAKIQIVSDDNASKDVKTIRFRRRLNL